MQIFWISVTVALSDTFLMFSIIIIIIIIIIIVIVIIIIITFFYYPHKTQLLNVLLESSLNNKSPPVTLCVQNFAKDSGSTQ